MSTKLPPIDPGNIRALVRLEGLEQVMFVDFATSELPGWLSSLDEGAQALARRPLIHGTDEGSATARMIFDQSLTVETYPLACLAALWICIYGTPHLPGFGLSMDDLQAAAGHGVITINVSRDRSAWNFHLAGRDVEHGGRKTLTPVATATATVH
jgi:hypothetical protein